MNADLPWGLQLALAALVGLALGLLAMWLILRQNSAKQKAHEALAQQFSDYRHKVDQHFVDTAAAVDELNRSYQKVVQHLSAGAQTLMGKEALQEQLAQRSNKAVTVSYLAAAAVEPLAQESDAGAAVQADRGEALYQHGSVQASYFHAWFPSCPSAVAALFGATIEG